MKKLVLFIAALLWIGDMSSARAESVELSVPLYRQYAMVMPYTGNVASTREPLKRAIQDLTGDTGVEIIAVWTYRELAGGQTTCGFIRVAGHRRKFVLQQASTSNMLGGGPVLGGYYANMDAPDYLFTNAGCSRNAETLVMPPRF